MHRLLHCLGFTLLLISVLLTGCGDAPAVPVARYASGLSDITSLDVAADKRTLHVLLAGHVDGAKIPVLRYTRSDDDGASWSTPVALPTDNTPPFRVRRGMDVQIAASGDRLVAVWSIAGTGYGGSGPMATAISQDGGQTWHLGPNPADDDSTEGHGFFGLTSADNGGFHVVWLDSRNGKQALYGARSSDGGQHWGTNRSIDAATCECCWNTIKAAANGTLFVLYRNIDPRDMALATSSNGESWRQAGPVGAFDWHFDGCPHTGGGLAIGPAGEQLHAVVWTGKTGAAGLYYLRSDNAGQRWSAPQRMGGETAQHADIALFDVDHIATVWDTTGAKGGVIHAATSADGGRHWASHQFADPGTAPTHPRIVATGHGWRIFWTEQKDGAGVWTTAALPVK